MKHAQTQGQETGLASLLEGTTPGPKLRLHEYEHAIYGTRLDIRLPKGEACPIVADLGPNEFSPCLEVQREFGRLLVERFAAAPALAASHCALVAALENAQSSLLGELGHYPMETLEFALLSRRTHEIAAALANARKMTAGMEGGTR